MKKILYLLFLLPVSTYAQNTFPASGNVGIGTTTPAAALHVVTPSGASGIVAQSTAAYSANGGAFLRLYNSGTPALVNQRLGGLLMGSNPTGSTLRTGAQIDAFSEDVWTDNVSHPTYLRFLTTPNGSIAPAERMRITADGNILIQQGTKFGIGLTDRFTYDGKPQPHYGMQWIMDSWASNGPTLWTSAYGGMKFFTQGIPRVTITVSGNVGIGTDDTKGYKFAVNGDAMFTRVKVKAFSSWPDYVFSEDYQLPALAEVANFIKEHKHLPEIPSAAEVEKEGLDLGEMNKKLLQKVEELTLYLIDMKKEINQLKEQNELLNKRINTSAQK